MIADNRNHCQPSPGREPQPGELEVDKLLKALVRLRGSELYLDVAQPPRVLVRGKLRPLNRAPMGDDEMVRLCDEMLDDYERRTFEQSGEVEFNFVLPFEQNICRFRVRLRRESGRVGLIAVRV
jgi:twitching motility protein PilT